MIFHPLHTTTPPPTLMSNPFSYTPHPLCVQAATLLQATLPALMARHPEEHGKMFGVLVVESGGHLGYLQAYSGQLSGGYPYTDEFVPPVFDYLSPTGHFRQTEGRISALNHRISQMAHDPSLLRREQAVRVLESCSDRAIARWRQVMATAKARRDALRVTADEATRGAMVRQSQYQKAQLRRIKQRWSWVIGAVSRRCQERRRDIDQLRRERRQMSDGLQQWLFDHFVLYNGRGEQRNLSQIFAQYDPQRPYLTPPGGTGECCEPKLLQYAYSHGMRPRCMAMFWWGDSPEGEVRHHLHYYPACQGKCRPTLTYMLQGLAVEPEATVTTEEDIEIVYEDAWIAVVNKPAGMLSVPGREGLASVAERMRRRYPTATGPLVVHRLDRDTSGLMLIALSEEVYRQLQQQFIRRQVRKRYVAVLEDNGLPLADHGHIDLPLSPHPTDRPRQQVDHQQGKRAYTEYCRQGQHRVALYPHTGRTHQLRVHCAHPQGLGRPIQGDPLYGHGQGRLCLHAESITFVHPVTKKEMTFSRKADF